MRAIVQRVTRASVAIGGAMHAEIGRGLVVLVGVGPDDTADDVAWLAGRISRLRIFADEAGKMNRSLLDLHGDVLAISQFTLFAEIAGNRPSFTGAAKPELARPLYQDFCNALATILGRPVATGIFAADMQVSLVNDGPVTIALDSRQR